MYRARPSKRTRRLLGVDLSSSMLAVARANLADSESGLTIAKRELRRLESPR